jgi:hypothetical protein
MRSVSLFGSALPRWLLGILLKMSGKARPPGVLHSYRAQKGMLHEAGYSATTSFWATPEMRYPTHYVPTDVTSIRSARRDESLVQGEYRSARFLMKWVPAGLV